MAFRSVIVLLLVAGYSYSASVPTRIVGGQLTTIDHYPSLAQVEEYSTNTGYWSQSCAANILTSRYVLTAAYCFTDSSYLPEYRRIRAGTSYRNTGGQVVNVYREIFHPKFGIGQRGDIVLVELLGQLEYSTVVQQVIIVAQGDELPDDSPVKAAGWGNTEVGGLNSEQLRDVTIFTVNNEECRARYAELPMEVTADMICAGVLDVGGQDTCTGDAGGPLYYNNILVGIISWGLGCADGTYPGVSTKVSAYTDWIVENAV